MTALLLLAGLALADPGAIAEAPPTARTWRERTPSRLLRGRGRIAFKAGYAIVDKNGVPDALRVGLDAGVLLFDAGPFGLSLDATFAYGHAELAGYTLQAGGNLEAEWLFVPQRIGLYVQTGLHWFASRSTEDRTGLLGRGVLGLRFMPRNSRMFVGFEPLAVERYPDGQGPYTPLRSRWGWAPSFLVIGVRP